MSAAAAQTVGKAALATMLGWTRPKLDRRLHSDAAFPVVTRGDQSGGWAFDPSSVQTYLGLGTATASKGTKAGAPVDQAQLRDAVVLPPVGAKTVSLPAPKPRRSAHHQGEATARQRKDEADASLRENKLRLENRELVARGDMRQKLADVFTSLGSDLDALADEIAKMLELPDEAPRIRDLIDKARARMVAQAAPILADD